MVEDLSTDGKEIADEEQLTRDTEERLTQNRIRVLNETELKDTTGNPLFHVSWNMMRNDLPGGTMYVYSVSVELYQAVLLERDENFGTLAPTLSSVHVGAVSAGRALNS